MDSITDSIRATGKVPGMTYASRVIRSVLPEEAARMGVPGDTAVLELRRTILADGEVVAYSYDLMPMSLFPPGFDPETLEGSLFAFLRRTLGVEPSHGVAEVHAVHSNHVGWGQEAKAHKLFVLLNQMHYANDDQPILYSCTRARTSSRVATRSRSSATTADGESPRADDALCGRRPTLTSCTQPP
jgi:GntR family transcriptional regulator